MEFEIGIGKNGRRAYGFDEVAIVPSRRTRDPEDVDIRWEIYKEPIKEELIGQRIREIKDGGVVACASLTPQRVERYAKLVVDAELDVLVIQGTVVSGEHVSSRQEPLNLKEFVPAFDLPVI